MIVFICWTCLDMDSLFNLIIDFYKVFLHGPNLIN